MPVLNVDGITKVPILSMRKTVWVTNKCYMSGIMHIYILYIYSILYA